MTDILTYDSSSEEVIKDSSPNLFEKFTGSDKDDRITITFNTSTSQIQNLRNIIDDYSWFQDKKDEYCIKAIRNLIIKNNFLELSLELSEEQITEEEYSQEIENHPEKYVIDLEYIKNPNDIKIINEIVKRIGVEFSIDEVSELFSLDSDDLETKVKQIEE